MGRLVFRGPSATAGYYRKPEATAAITRPGGWLDSGDLAYRAEGELFVTGRRKDLIIKAGRNLVPAGDRGDRGLRARRSAAAAWSRSACRGPSCGTESLVVVAETRATDPAAREALAARR